MTVERADLEKIYDWRQTQATSLASACFTLTGLILSPLLAAVFESKAELRPWPLCAYLLGALFAAVAGLLWHREARQLQQEYINRAEGLLEW